MPVKCHGDDIFFTFHNTLLFFLLILLIYVNKFNIHNTFIILSLRLVYVNQTHQTLAVVINISPPRRYTLEPGMPHHTVPVF